MSRWKGSMLPLFVGLRNNYEAKGGRTPGESRPQARTSPDRRGDSRIHTGGIDTPFLDRWGSSTPATSVFLRSWLRRE